MKEREGMTCSKGPQIRFEAWATIFVHEVQREREREKEGERERERRRERERERETHGKVQRAPGVWGFRVFLVTVVSVQQLQIRTTRINTFSPALKMSPYTLSNFLTQSRVNTVTTQQRTWSVIMWCELQI